MPDQTEHPDIKRLPEHDPDASQALFEQLAAEEPPVERGDTSPSATAPRPAVKVTGAGSQRYLGGSILLAALLLTMAAALIIFLRDETDVTKQDDRGKTQEAPLVFVGPTPTPVPDLATTPVNPVNILPTTAADEEAVALLTPAPNTVDTGPAIGRDPDPFTFQVSATERGFTVYTVQPGDTLSNIRERYGLDICTIVWSNDRNKVSPLRPGVEIVIPPVDGVFARIREPMTIDKLAQDTQVEPSTIIDSPYNPALVGATADSLLVEGMQIMVPNGKGGNCNIWEAKPSAASGASSGGNAGSYSLWGCTAEIKGAYFPVQNPVSGRYTFFRGFSPSHTGVDLAADIGTPVVAAGSGVVIFSGVSQYGYGNVIVIAHGSTFTLYAHLESRSVRCGQDVSQGQVIGEVGNTGNSSGPHLHFEIRNANFDPIDPIYTIPSL